MVLKKIIMRKGSEARICTEVGVGVRVRVRVRVRARARARVRARVRVRVGPPQASRC